MVENLDLSQVSEDQLNDLVGHLVNLQYSIENSNNEFELKREAVDKVIFQSETYEYETRAGYAYNSNSGMSELDASIEEANFGEDEFSTLRDPALYRVYRAWVNNIKNACFPSSDDWIDVKRTYSSWFSQNGLREFLQNVNEAWLNILKTENQRYLFKKKYSAAIAEMVAYGNTGVVHYYDPDEHYVNLKVPGINNLSVFPVTDRWRESNLIIQYDVNYSELTARTDLDQEIVAAIKPQTSLNRIHDNKARGATRKAQDDKIQTPYGKVKLIDIYIPSLFLQKNSEEEPITGEGLYFTLAYNVELQSGFSPENFGYRQNTFILKAKKNVSRIDHGILLAAAGSTLPGVFYHRGFIEPFLSHQKVLNQNISALGRITALIEDPPLSLIRQTDYDYEKVEAPNFEPGAFYEGWDVKALIPPEYFQVQNQFVNTQGIITNVIEQSSGLSKAQLAGLSSGRKSASEIREVASSGQLNIVDATNQFDEEILQPSICNRVILTQTQLKDQIEQEVLTNLEPIPEELKYEQALLENKLFQRLMEFSGIEQTYLAYFEQNRHELFQNQEIFNQIQDMMKQIKQIQDFAVSEIPDYVPPIVQTNPETGEQIPSIQELEMMKQQYYQSEEQKRNEALAQIPQIEMQIEAKELQIDKTLQQAPKPSLKLYYDMLVYSISESDIVITGSKTTLSKDFARQNIKEFTGFLQAVPEVASQYDLSTVMEYFARTLALPIEKLKKSPSQIRREEEAAAQRAALQEELVKAAPHNQKL